MAGEGPSGSTVGLSDWEVDYTVRSDGLEQGGWEVDGA